MSRRSRKNFRRCGSLITFSGTFPANPYPGQMGIAPRWPLLASAPATVVNGQRFRLAEAGREFGREYLGVGGAWVPQDDVTMGVWAWDGTVWYPTDVQYPISIDGLLTVGTFGDSTATIVEGGTTSIYSGTTGIYPNMIPLSYMYPVLMVADGGVWGQTVQTSLNRSLSAPSATRKATEDVIAINPNLVFFHCGSINDFYSMTESTPIATVDAVISAHIEGIRRLTTQGIHVIDSGVYGVYRGDVSAERLTAIKSYIVMANNAYKAEALGKHYHHFVDVEGVLSVGGEFISGISSDGIHLNSHGSYLLGTLENQVALSLYRSGGVLGVKAGLDCELAWANTGGNRPVGFNPFNWDTTIHSEVCTAEKYIVDFTVTSTNSLMALASPAVASFYSGFSINELASVELRINLKDEDGIDFEHLLWVDLAIHNGDDSANTQYLMQDGNIKGDTRFIRQVKIPYSTLNTGWFGLGIGSRLLPLGRYTMEIYPPIIRKYT